jgi:hypothetical protein
MGSKPNAHPPLPQNFENPCCKGKIRTTRIPETGGKRNCHGAITGNIGTAIFVFSNIAFENK